MLKKYLISLDKDIQRRELFFSQKKILRISKFFRPLIPCKKIGMN